MVCALEASSPAAPTPCTASLQTAAAVTPTGPPSPPRYPNFAEEVRALLAERKKVPASAAAATDAPVTPQPATPTGAGHTRAEHVDIVVKKEKEELNSDSDLEIVGMVMTKATLRVLKHTAVKEERAEDGSLAEATVPTEEPAEDGSLAEATVPITETHTVADKQNSNASSSAGAAPPSGGQGASAGAPNQAVFCPQGHCLRHFSCAAEWQPVKGKRKRETVWAWNHSCDLCPAENLKRAWCCEPCEYDVCETCHTKRLRQA